MIRQIFDKLLLALPPSFVVVRPSVRRTNKFRRIGSADHKQHSKYIRSVSPDTVRLPLICSETTSWPLCVCAKRVNFCKLASAAVVRVSLCHAFASIHTILCISASRRTLFAYLIYWLSHTVRLQLTHLCLAYCVTTSFIAAHKCHIVRHAETRQTPHSAPSPGVFDSSHYVES